MDRDEAIFAANVQSLAALALLEDLFEFLAQQDADALRAYDERSGRYPTRWSDLGPRYNQ